MLVNASQFPGPALWQGLMLIVAAAWAVFIYWPREELISGRAFFGSLGVVLAIGAVLMVLVIVFL